MFLTYWFIKGISKPLSPTRILKIVLHFHNHLIKSVLTSYKRDMNRLQTRNKTRLNIINFFNFDLSKLLTI